MMDSASRGSHSSEKFVKSTLSIETVATRCSRWRGLSEKPVLRKIVAILPTWLTVILCQLFLPPVCTLVRAISTLQINDRDFSDCFREEINQKTDISSVRLARYSRRQVQRYPQRETDRDRSRKKNFAKSFFRSRSSGLSLSGRVFVLVNNPQFQQCARIEGSRHRTRSCGGPQ
jgi:hypothetical protein